jgi:predicted amidohydrolase YtcJ
LACSAVASAETADTVFSNANVYTGDERQPRAEAIAIKGERIIFVGSTDKARPFITETTRVIDLHGQTVLPGLTDSHCHIFGIGERELNLNLEGTRTRADFFAKVEKRFAETDPGRWVTGRGWIETFWDPPTFPTAADLDKVAPGSPVFLTRADGHAAIVNSAALQRESLPKRRRLSAAKSSGQTTGQPTGMPRQREGLWLDTFQRRGRKGRCAPPWRETRN